MKKDFDIESLFSKGSSKTSATIDQLLSANEAVKELPIKEIHSFKLHPFKVYDDELTDLIESIKINGVVNPVIVRKDINNGGYELISGHRRKRACELLGFAQIPSVIRELSDDEATILMVDSNIYREKILPSEKAFAYKMKLEAIKRQSGRPLKNNLTPMVSDLQNVRTNEILAAEVGESREQIRRYIRLTYLKSELLDMTDNEKIPFRAAVEISYLSGDEQSLLFDYLFSAGKKISLKQAIELREIANDHKLNTIDFDKTFSQKKNNQGNITFGKSEVKRINDYFPKEYDNNKKINTIITLLDAWHKNQE